MNDNTKTWLSHPHSPNPSCTIIAEVAQAHEGSLGMAHAYIDAAFHAGADAVKFQTHIAHAESSALEPWRVAFSSQDKTRYEYWKRMEFTPEQWLELKQHANEKGLLFLSSPFSLEAVELLKSIGIAGWKIASGEITNKPMLEEIAKTEQPIILSTGMSPISEVEQAVNWVRTVAPAHAKQALCILQCSTQYPSPPEKIGLNQVSEMARLFNCATGLSDHSGTIFPSLAAVTLGAQVLEVHLTLSRDMFGPDVVASITPKELKQLVEGVRFIEKMNANPMDKSQIEEALQVNRNIFLKSVVLQDDLPKGTLLEYKHLATRKPGTGISASRIDEVVGRVLNRAIDKNVPLQEDDLS